MILSTGFCSVKFWASKIERNILELIQEIHNEIESFDFEENYDKLIKRYHHMPLFSVCLDCFKMQKILWKKTKAIVKFVQGLEKIATKIMINFQIWLFI